MRYVTIAAVVVATAGFQTAAFDRVLAQAGPGEFLVGVESPLLTLSVGPGGIKLLRARRAPVTVQPGSMPGTLTVTSVVEDPRALFLTSVATLEAAGQRIVITNLRSRDDAAVPFNRTVAWQANAPASARQNFVGRWIYTDTDPLFVGIGLRPQIVTPQNTTYNHAFAFLDSRSDLIVADTNTALRNRATWNLVVGPGLVNPVGQNFNFAFANVGQAATTNFFRLTDEHSGAIVTCEGNIRPCFVAGTGAFDGYWGDADSLSISGLGTTADAASFTTITGLSTVVPGRGPCPPGPPPPPTGLIAGRKDAGFDAGGAPEDDIFVAWDSVACARRYHVRYRDAQGVIATEVITRRTRADAFDPLSGDLESFTVASIDENGVEGPESPPHPIPRLPLPV